ncbi:hypothetical protein [Fredinandcohnia quinoae]|uniref:Uncharacterized protein n=1 Tax=Fredinandcohnia quinoae TaxID=2918902 RepID=A0AAW5EAW7_9BACI|nr:hypothetical protein [Fredinandcohnia sp. SECRCQ15]MCH1627171.1 hypothetical protein [Fredinandcohnia sp. SECRCQ15]
MIRQLLDDELDEASLSFLKKEVLRKEEAIFPKEVEGYLKLSDKTIRKVLSHLVDKNMLMLASGIKMVRSYRLRNQVKLPIR